ncbi:MAG: hypothetical protein EP326_04315 [Deltaproteobacteria bacterium]|nr:MAG: hypothetical protein EP326_04315 [Deltaproteobacteria bacterium]
MINTLNARLTLLNTIAGTHFAVGAVTILTAAYFDRLDFLETHFFSYVHQAGLFRIGDYSSFGMYFTGLAILALGYMTLVAKSMVINKNRAEEAITEEEAITVLERQNFVLLEGQKDLTEQPKSDRTIQVPVELIFDTEIESLIDQNIEENQIRQ